MKNIMYNSILLLVQFGLFVCFSMSTQAQSPEVNWDKTLGGAADEYFKTALEIPGGGYLLAGHTTSGISGEKSEHSRGSFDFWLVQIDSQGQKIWDKTLGGAGYDQLKSILPVKGGGYIMLGNSSSGISGEKSEPNRGGGNLDYWVVRINEGGEKIWDKTFGGSNEEDALKIISTPDGGFLLSGLSFSEISGDKSENNRGLYDLWLVKIDSLGNKLWDKTYGGLGEDGPVSMINTPDEGFIISGFSEIPGTGDVSPGSGSGWLLALDKMGNKIWDKVIPPSPGYIELTSNNEILLTGNDYSKPNRDYSLYWYTLTGDFLRNKFYGGDGTERITGWIPTKDPGYLLFGTSNSDKSGQKTEDSRGGYDFWILKVDANWNVLWDKTLGGGGYEYSPFVVECENGEIILAGNSDSGISPDKSEASINNAYWLVKISPEGEVITDKTYTGNDSERLHSFIKNKKEQIFLAGLSRSGAFKNKSEPNRGEMDFWVLEIDPEKLTQSAPPTLPDLNIFMEAECAHFTGSEWSVINDPAASGGSYLVIPSERERYNYFHLENRLMFHTTLEQGGYYHLFARVRTPSFAEDSFWIRINKGPWIKWKKGVFSSKFNWKEVNKSPFLLPAGRNLIEFALREDGAQLDKLCLNTTGVKPEGMGGAAENCNRLWLEAECAEVGNRWNIMEDNQASGDKFLQVRVGYNSWAAPPGDLPKNQVKFSFLINASGMYQVYARQAGMGTKNDSYWFKLDDGEWQQGKLNREHNLFHWKPLYDPATFLDAGTHTLTFAYREERYRLDKIYVGTSYSIRHSELGPEGVNCVEPLHNPNIITQEEPVSLKVGPNPSSDVINIQMPDRKQTSQYALYNTRGQLIQQGKVTQSTWNLSLAGLKSGLYILKLQQGGEQWQLKLVKE